jgi:hypothetical protein
MTAQFAQQLNQTLGTKFTGGTPWANLSITWKGAPSAVMPLTPATAGLRMFTDALRPGLS